jgi:hypothetical protein
MCVHDCAQHKEFSAEISVGPTKRFDYAQDFFLENKSTAFCISLP